MFKWLKRNKLNQQTKKPEWTQEFREDNYRKGMLNYLSPDQILKVIKNNKDIDFLEDELIKEMETSQKLINKVPIPVINESYSLSFPTKLYSIGLKL